MDTLFVCRDKTNCSSYIDILRKNNIPSECSTNTKEAIGKSIKIQPNLIFVDINIDGQMDGFELCETLRKNKLLDNSVISFLTDSHENFSKISAYKAGADDYIETPINAHLFLHKVESLLNRRNRNKQESNPSTISINRNAYEVSLNGIATTLPRKEFEIISLLFSDLDKIFSRQEIIQHVWKDSDVVNPRTIDVHIRKIRKCFGDTIISSYKGIGYKASI